MADTKISAATAVTTPAAADEYATNQGGASKRTTRAQMHALESGEHLVLPQVNEAATPTLAFGDGDSGLHEYFDDRMALVLAGSNFILFDNSIAQMQITGDIKTTNTSGGGILNETASDSNPTVLARNGDEDSGVGSSAADAISLIGGGIEGLRVTELNSGCILSLDNTATITANTNSAQGDTPLIASINVISVSANAGDAVTLPAVFAAGSIVIVKNDGAQSADVFPASGDDAGGGADTAVAVAAGAAQIFVASVANSTWTQLL